MSLPRARLVLLSVLATACATAPATRTLADAAELEAAARAFLTAFEDLDQAPFRAAFADDACVFFPAGPGAQQRVCGRAEVEARFDEVFAQERRASTATGPPYLLLRPQDLLATPLDADTGVVTFTLRNEVRLARRTLVLRRQAGRWRIVHLHASNLPLR